MLKKKKTILKFNILYNQGEESTQKKPTLLLSLIMYVYIVF